MSRISLSAAALVVLGLAAPLIAQEAPATTQTPDRVLPPIRYSLPPGEGAAAQEAPAVVPTPPPVVTPTPTPRPTPSATARPAPTATPRPAPTPTATLAPRAVEARPAAEVDDPTPVPTDAPEPVPPPVVVPADTAPTAAAPTPINEAPATVEPVAGERGGNGWLIAALIAIAALLAGFLLRRRRKAAEVTVSDAVIPTQPEAAASPVRAAPSAPEKPAPLAPPIATPPPVIPVAAPPPLPADDEPQFLSRPAGAPLAPRAPVPAGTITAFRDRPKPADAGFVTAFRRPAPNLGIEVQPIRAGTSGETGFLEFQFAFLNQSDQAVSDMMVSAWMLTANADQDAQIAAYLSEPADPSQHTLYALQPGEHREHRATMGEALDKLNVVEAAGRRFFAPILLVDARYRAAGGGTGRSTAAFVVGRPNPATGKLLPIYVDRGDRLVEGLAARSYPLPRTQAA